jgi:hypothetical protein
MKIIEGFKKLREDIFLRQFYISGVRYIATDDFTSIVKNIGYDNNYVALAIYTYLINYANKYKTTVNLHGDNIFATNVDNIKKLLNRFESNIEDFK